MRPILVTSCTNRKKRPVAALLKARALQAGRISSVVSEWADRVRHATDLSQARDLYAGRAFDESIKATSSAADLYVVSAGLGLVASETLIPAYSLTVTGSDPDNVLLRVEGDGSVTPAHWWKALTTELGMGAPLADLAARNPDDVIVLALPKTYLQLVSEELSGLSDKALQRIRIVGVKSSADTLPSRIAASSVAYDERFETAGPGFGGTRSDFAQRVARHFLTSILPGAPAGSVEEHNAAVAQFLARHVARATPHRPRHSDDELKDIIRDLWVEVGGRVTAGLRTLRRERQIACEQSRFKRLFDEVSEEKRNANA